MRISICIASCQRPRLLEQLLLGLAQMTFTKNPRPAIDVIVADNDAAGSAKSVCENTPLPWRLTYVIEPRRGIAQARNRALQEVTDADFVAFIDDDELPDPQWLDELLATQAVSQADVVSGPVIPSFTEDVPDWAKLRSFFESETYPTGQVLEWCATNNALVSNKVFSRVGNFDERFQLSGADDLHFFIRTSRAGFRIVWCAEAVVRERISRDRANAGWLLRRAYRGGNCYALVEAAVDHRFKTRCVRFAKACGRIVQGALTSLVSVSSGKAGIIHSLRYVWLGAGMLTGLFDLKYQAYKTVMETDSGVSVSGARN